jgi:hypothetical protein
MQRDGAPANDSEADAMAQQRLQICEFERPQA